MNSLEILKYIIIIIIFIIFLLSPIKKFIMKKYF